MNESEKKNLGELVAEASDLNEKQKIYLSGVIDGMKASKEEKK